MILPLGTDRPLKRPTLVNHALIALNVGVFVAGIVLTSRAAPDSTRGVFDRLLLDPQKFEWWQLLSYQFLHAGPLHLAGNMLFLWTFGPNVEDRFGRLWYALFYLLGGAAAGGVHCALSAHPVLGASGAVSGVTGAYLILFPRTLIRVFLLFFFIGIFQIPAAWFLGASIAWDILFNSGGRSNVAVGAHVGGYVWGGGLSALLLWARLLPREQFDLLSLARQARRRRDFKTLTASGRSGWAHEAPTGRKKGAPPAPVDEGPALRRAAVAAALAANDAAGAAGAYRALLSVDGRASLPRSTQLGTANLLFAAEERDLAAEAYSIFLDKHPRDAEAPRVRLMLALISARYLNDPERAKALLAEAKPMLTSPDLLALAEELVAELG